MTVQELINQLEALPNKTLRVFVPHCEASSDCEVLEEPLKPTIVQHDSRGYEYIKEPIEWKVQRIPGPYVIIE